VIEHAASDSVIAVGLACTTSRWTISFCATHAEEQRKWQEDGDTSTYLRQYIILLGGHFCKKQHGVEVTYSVSFYRGLGHYRNYVLLDSNETSCMSVDPDLSVDAADDKKYRPTLLVIEKDTDMGKVLKMSLKGDYVVKLVTTGKNIWDNITAANPDIVISIGGDGMLLSAFHKYENQLDKVRFVGVHTGHLGFYTDYRDFELDQLVTNLQLDSGAKVSYPVLNVKVTLENGDVKTFRALNEASIRRSDRTMVADIIINHVPFERFRGDGVTVSTPTGSTAYNKSLGGAVLHPTIEALQLTEIASLNNRVYRTLGSSIIVPKKDKIELLPTRNDYHTLSVDNSTYSFRNIERIEYQIDHHKIHFVATPSHTSFWNRVKDAFIGEVDE